MDEQRRRNSQGTVWLDGQGGWTEPLCCCVARQEAGWEEGIQVAGLVSGDGGWGNAQEETILGKAAAGCKAGWGCAASGICTHGFRETCNNPGFLFFFPLSPPLTSPWPLCGRSEIVLAVLSDTTAKGGGCIVSLLTRMYMHPPGHGRSQRRPMSASRGGRKGEAETGRAGMDIRLAFASPWLQLFPAARGSLARGNPAGCSLPTRPAFSGTRSARSPKRPPQHLRHWQIEKECLRRVRHQGQLARMRRNSETAPVVWGQPPGLARKTGTVPIPKAPTGRAGGVGAWPVRPTRPNARHHSHHRTSPLFRSLPRTRSCNAHVDAHNPYIHT